MSLHDLQHELELESLHMGIERDQRSRDTLEDLGQAASHPLYTSVIRGLMPSVARAVERQLREVKRSDRHIVMLRSMPPEVLAFCGLWQAFNNVGQPMRRMCLGIGGAIEDHLWTEAIREADAKAAEDDEDAGAGFERHWARIKERNAGQRQRRRALEHYAEELSVEFERWDAPRKLQVGSVVINAMLAADAIVLRKDPEGVDELDFSHGVLAALSDLNQEAPWIRAATLPMIVAPKPWRGWDDGGYLTRNSQRMNPLVRSGNRKHRQLVEDAIKAGSMDRCLMALNVIQATPWRINRRMLDIITECHERGLEIDGLPRKKLHEVPPRLPEDASKDELILARWKRAKVRRRNLTLQGQLVTFRADVSTARRFVEHERIWLPHNMDFRGRVYPIPHFNQQRSDYVKAMMDFADGVDLTEEGRIWLFIHAANCGDFDKVSKRPFDDRVAWTKDNLGIIYDCAEDPFGQQFWMKADKPFEFLRACIELRDLWLADCHDYQFTSHLPIQIDGSNSGLQHYSAFLRSSGDGAQVNLVPSDVPADVYAEVARRVEEVAKASTDPLAQLWLAYGITRKVVKRNVMTFPYSSEAFGFREQIMEDLMTPLADAVIDKKIDRHPFGDDEGWAAAGWMAKHVYQAVIETVSCASGAMRWFKTVAGALAHEGHGLTYVTPIGLPVLHEYTEWDVRRVIVLLLDKSVSLQDATSEDKVTDEGVYRRIRSSMRMTPTRVIVKSKQKSAVSPNIVHSMDGSHLMLTTLAALDAGVQCFSLIHDSFGTHASHMGLMFRTVRQAMVDMYESYDTIDHIRQAASAALSPRGLKKIASAPERGDLDLRLILKSEYAFA